MARSEGLASGEVLVVIPARGGSKGIRRKNLADLGGRPLLAWTVRAALASRRVTRTVVSTEDDGIRRAAAACGAEVPFRRPRSLSGDGVHAARVVLHALDELRRLEGYEPRIVVMLLPTSPLRTTGQIDAAVDLFLARRLAGSVVSVRRSKKGLPHLRRVRRGLLRPLARSGLLNVQRQDVEPLFELNGSIYVSTPRAVRRHRGFHGPSAAPFVMDWRTSLDVNEPEDLELARVLLRMAA